MSDFQVPAQMPTRQFFFPIFPAVTWQIMTSPYVAVPYCLGESSGSGFAQLTTRPKSVLTHTSDDFLCQVTHCPKERAVPFSKSKREKKQKNNLTSSMGEDVLNRYKNTEKSALQVSALGFWSRKGAYQSC